jgi:crossover junction endodeoxyribonuclease RuvC
VAARGAVGEGDLLLGIDPGLAATGWGLIDNQGQAHGCGTIATKPGAAGPRLLHITHELRAVLAANSVSEVALEELFMGRNATSVIGVAEARGAILAALAAAGLPVFEYKPAQVKAALTGYGMAGKAQMARMLALQVRIAGKLDEHAADALAVALCHARSRRLRQLVAAPLPSNPPGKTPGFRGDPGKWGGGGSLARLARRPP